MARYYGTRDYGFTSRGESNNCVAFYPHSDYKINGKYYCTARMAWRYPQADGIHRREVADPGMVTTRTEYKIAGKWREA